MERPKQGNYYVKGMGGGVGELAPHAIFNMERNYKI